MVANYATQAFTATLGTAQIFVDAGARRDTITDASTIALWPANFTANPPVAGGTVSAALFQYLAANPAGPQVS